MARPPRRAERHAPAQPGADERAHPPPTTHLPAGHAEGFADTFRELYRAVYRAIAAGEPGDDYPTFRAGHVENVLGEAIARSNSEQRWVEVDAVKLGLLTAAFPDLSLDEVAAWAAANGFETARGRVLAGGRRREAPLRRRLAHRRRRARRRRGARDARAARRRDLVARLLPQQPASRRRRTARGGERAPAQGDRRGAGARRRHRRHVRRQRQGPAAAGEPRALPSDLARARRRTRASAA